MRITLVHALKHSIVPIEAAFARLWPDARLMNLMDDSLSADLARDGGLTDAMTQDASALAGSVTTAAPNPADYVILPTTISKEPLGPFTRNGDEAWSDIIAWLHYGLIEAEELGVTQANADEMAKSQVPAVQRLLGSAGDLGSRLNLDNKWMLVAIKAVGNYSEIFERNVGKSSPLKLDRGLNATWTKGGLMYAIPFK